MSDSYTLADKLASIGNLVDHFYNDTFPPHAKANPQLTPVPQEHTSWIEEQRAWRQTATIFDQTHHMPELFVRGPDAMRLLSSIGVNSFTNFKPNSAKQFVGCNFQGQMIGESIVYCYNEQDFELVSGMPLLNWVQYNAEAGGYDVSLVRDNHTAANPTGRRIKFRFGMDGPNAAKIFEESIDGAAPAIKFFHTAQVSIAVKQVTALRHGMAGHQGVELSGKFEDGQIVLARVLEVGSRHGLRQGGNLAYFSSITESGWMGSPFPAIFTAPELAKYRQYLPANTWEAGAQLGGSFVGERLEDYYVTPFDLGLEGRIRFDHDFIGSEALQKLAQSPRRTKRTLVWNKEDVARLLSSVLQPGERPKLLRLPYASYAYQQYDLVRDLSGRHAALSCFAGYSTNESEMVSLAMVDVDRAQIGTELVLTWGEPDGGSRKRNVERHIQTTVRVTVAPALFAETVRKVKHGTVGTV
jgi:vanillate/3-O-methylgallate O-demethylase